MSIATDEAEEIYPAPTDDDDPMYKYFDAIEGYPSEKRQAYIAGRTAEPTEAEIEAAMDVIKIEVGELTLSEELAKDALFAARKAVTE